MTQDHPDLSLVMPCYNEEGNVAKVIGDLAGAFARAGHRLQLVAVDNGSTDGTGALILEAAARFPVVVHHRVETNIGYGYGILRGLSLCTAPWVGLVHADGQVDADDVVRLYEAAVAARGRVLAKIRRRFRMDGPVRKIVSVSYNLFIRLLWPRLGSIDVNGAPKLLPREAASAMHLSSTGWLLDPEIMVKAQYLGLRVLEVNVLARMRSNGLSHVRATTCWAFIRGLLSARLSQRWKRAVRHDS